MSRWFPLCLIMILSLAGPVLAQGDEEQLASLDIEELMDVEVVSASRRPEPLSQVAGAITVLDEEDIFRSGATTLPEVLKLVPGVHVAQVDTDKWAVGIRGFNGLLSNKHLVLVDGRPITSQSMVGVSWGDNLPVSLIKRVEVVRGVWTSLWGADSFTGVINVITKTAEEAQGGQSITMFGTTGVEQTIRYGGEMGESGHFVGYGNGGYKTGSWLTGEGFAKGSENWKKGQAGFRADWLNAFTDVISFQSNMTLSRIDDSASGSDIRYKPKEKDRATGYGQLTWDRATGLDAGLQFRTSFTRNTEDIPGVNGASNVVDVEFQQAVEQIGIHRLTWGIGGRYYWDELKAEGSTSIDVKSRTLGTASSFLQDKMTLIDERFFLILGLKADHLGQGVEIQPTMRLLHTNNDREFWVAMSRAVRAENRLQRDGSYTVDHRGTSYTVTAPGDLATEKLLSYEAGYRQKINQEARLDLNLYVNEYQDLIAFEVDTAANTATLTNNLKGTAYGMESILEWHAASWLELRPSISLIYQDLYDTIILPGDEAMPGEGLGNEFKLEVMTTPSENVGVDVFAAYLDSPDQKQISGFLQLQGHVSWQASDSLLLELIGRNLDGGHRQFSRLKVGPSLDLRMTWDF